MPDVDEECKFTTGPDQVKFTTQTNGDQVIIRDLELSQEQATSLTWLVNADGDNLLEFSLKMVPKPEPEPEP